MIEDFKLITN